MDYLDSSRRAVLQRYQATMGQDDVGLIVMILFALLGYLKNHPNLLIFSVGSIVALVFVLGWHWLQIACISTTERALTVNLSRELGSQPAPLNLKPWRRPDTWVLNYEVSYEHLADYYLEFRLRFITVAVTYQLDLPIKGHVFFRSTAVLNRELIRTDLIGLDTLIFERATPGIHGVNGGEWVIILRQNLSASIAAQMQQTINDSTQQLEFYFNELELTMSDEDRGSMRIPFPRCFGIVARQGLCCDEIPWPVQNSDGDFN